MQLYLAGRRRYSGQWSVFLLQHHVHDVDVYESSAIRNLASLAGCEILTQSAHGDHFLFTYVVQ